MLLTVAVVVAVALEAVGAVRMATYMDQNQLAVANKHNYVAALISILLFASQFVYRMPIEKLRNIVVQGRYHLKS